MLPYSINNYGVPRNKKLRSVPGFKKMQTRISNKLESIKNRFSKTAKEELGDEIASDDKIASIFLIVVNGLFGLYLIVHQTVSTGFFTSKVQHVRDDPALWNFHLLDNYISFNINRSKTSFT